MGVWGEHHGPRYYHARSCPQSGSGECGFLGRTPLNTGTFPRLSLHKTAAFTTCAGH